MTPMRLHDHVLFLAPSLAVLTVAAGRSRPTHAGHALLGERLPLDVRPVLAAPRPHRLPVDVDRPALDGVARSLPAQHADGPAVSTPGPSPREVASPLPTDLFVPEGLVLREPGVRR